MKTIKLGVLLLSLSLFTSCKNDENKEVVTEKETTIEKTVIVQDTVKVEKEAEQKGTSVKISNDGVEVESKNVDVELKK